MWYNGLGMPYATARYADSRFVDEPGFIADLPIGVLKCEEPLSHQIAKLLERLILKGAIKNGERLLTERALAEMFGVSCTVIREAVRILAIEN